MKKIRLDFCQKTTVSQTLTLPRTQIIQSEQSAQDPTGPRPESIAPNVQSLPEGKAECITGGLSPQTPKCSSYRAPQGATRKAHTDGIPLSSRQACRAAPPGLAHRAPSAAQGRHSPSPL